MALERFDPQTQLSNVKKVFSGVTEVPKLVEQPPRDTAVRSVYPIDKSVIQQRRREMTPAKTDDPWIQFLNAQAPEWFMVDIDKWKKIIAFTQSKHPELEWEELIKKAAEYLPVWKQYEDEQREANKPKPTQQEMGQRFHRENIQAPIQNLLWGIAWGFSKLWPNLAWWLMKGLWTSPFEWYMKAQWEDIQPNVLQRWWQELISRWQQMSDITEWAFWADPEATATQVGRQVAPILATYAWWNVLWTNAWWMEAMQWVSQALKAKQVAPVVGNLLKWWAIWATEWAMYDLANKWEVTPEWVAYWAIGQAAFTGLPILVKAATGVKDVWGNVLKRGAKKVWKLSEQLATKWLLNVRDARVVLKSLWETADDDVWAIGRWLLEKNVVWWDEKSVISKVWEVARKQYNNVRKVLWRVDQNAWPVGVDENVWKAMTIVGKQIDSINARAWVDVMNKVEVDEILLASQNWTLTLSQKQRAKELMDEFVSIYKKSWDPADTLLSKAAEPIRNKMKNEIEDAVTLATQGKINLREMNRDVAIAKSIEHWVETKQVANELKQYVIQGTIWWTLWTQGNFDFSDPTTYIKFLAWAFLWSQVGKILSSPTFNSNIAKLLDNLSFGTRKTLLEYAKNPTTVKLSQNALQEILTAKKSITSLASTIDNATPMSPAMGGKSISSVLPDNPSVVTEWLTPQTLPTTKTDPLVKSIAQEPKKPIVKADSTKLSPKAKKPLIKAEVASKVDDALPVWEKMKQSAKSLESADLTTSIKKAKAEGKTFDEFVDKSSEFYHWSPNASIIDEIKYWWKWWYFWDGVYLSRDKWVAEKFTRLEDMNRSLEPVWDWTFINMNTWEKVVTPWKPWIIKVWGEWLKLKRITIDEYETLFEKFRDQKTKVIDVEKAHKAIQDKFISEWYDGFDVPKWSKSFKFDEEQVLIFPQSIKKLKTPSQLRTERDKLSSTTTPAFRK